MSVQLLAVNETTGFPGLADYCGQLTEFRQFLFISVVMISIQMILIKSAIVIENIDDFFYRLIIFIYFLFTV